MATKRSSDQSTDTTLQDLPIEMLERILVEVVATEVMEMKLAKSVWTEKADLAIGRMGTVCSQWTRVFTSSFRTKLDRILDGTAEPKIRLEILHQYPIQLTVRQLVVLKEDIFVLWGFGYFYVFDVNDVATVKEVINLKTVPLDVGSCPLSNCVYLLFRAKEDCVEVVRYRKTDNQKYIGSKVMENVRIPNFVPSISVSANGSIILQQCKHALPVLHVFNADGVLQKKLNLLSVVPPHAKHCIIPKPNGNLVLVSTVCDVQTSITLTEINMDGNSLRQRFGLNAALTCQLGRYGRLFLSDYQGSSQVLDSEFNLLSLSPSRLGENMAVVPRVLYYSNEREETFTVGNNTLTVSRLTED